MSEPLFTGVGVALVTLFDSAGEVDLPATAAHAGRLVEAGVQAVVTSGSTGEAAALSADERTAVLDAVAEAVDDRVPVIAGTGAASARQAAALTADARKHGADAVLALSPPGSRRLRDYYETVAEAAEGLPVLAYHFPATSAPGVPVDTLAELPVVGVKDSSGDPDRLLEELAATDKAIYVGSSAILALAGPLGCRGAILALANAEPHLCAMAFSGDAGAQRALTQAHLTHKRAFPAGLKDLVAERFGTSRVARL